MNKFTKFVLAFVFVSFSFVLGTFVYILVDDAKHEIKSQACCSADTCSKYHHHN